VFVRYPLQISAEAPSIPTEDFRVSSQYSSTNVYWEMGVKLHGFFSGRDRAPADVSSPRTDMGRSMERKMFPMLLPVGFFSYAVSNAD
jgi:hypothetical protein